jgi:hypothetical protein
MCFTTRKACRQSDKVRKPPCSARISSVSCSFTDKVRRVHLWPWSKNVTFHEMAIFRQINQDNPVTCHVCCDATLPKFNVASQKTLLASALIQR